MFAQASLDQLEHEDDDLTDLTRMGQVTDTVDQTDEEDINKNATGSPKNRKKKKKKRPRTVINPYGNVYFYWLCVLTICVLYNLWTPIVRQAFPELQSSPQPMWYLLDGLTDMVFLLDILVQFRTGYLEQGLIVYDFKKLAKHYMHSRSFMLDLISLFPLDFLQFLIGSHPIIRFPRFIKVYRVYNYYYMVESRTLYPNMWRVVNLIHILLLLAHWFGCFYYMLSEAEHFSGYWTYPYYQDSAFKTLSRKYLGSVYWSTLTLTTIGDLPTPETNRQLVQSCPDILTQLNKTPYSPLQVQQNFEIWLQTSQPVHSISSQLISNHRCNSIYVQPSKCQLITLNQIIVIYVLSCLNSRYLYSGLIAQPMLVKNPQPYLPDLLKMYSITHPETRYTPILNLVQSDPQPNPTQLTA